MPLRDAAHRGLRLRRRLRDGALIGRDGSVDWLCWPRFDSGACFAALLGGPEHGRWRIAPAHEVVRTERGAEEE